MSRKKSQVLELEPLVACLASRVEASISKKAYFSLTPKFYHKSGAELKLEDSQRVKLLTASINF
jgi:hypothetical protein